MNLLPVIYASLLIFGSLFLIVLVTSYITYKVKQLNNSVALATATQKKSGRRTRHIKKNSERVNIVRKGSSDRQTLNLEKNARQQISYSEHTTSRSDMPKLEKRIREQSSRPESSYRNERKQPFVRMTRVQDLRSSNAYSTSNKVSEYKPPASQHSTVSQGSILRYYEDF